MKLTLSQQLTLLAIGLLAAALQLLAGCGDSRSNAHAVYLLIDTSGTYAKVLGKYVRDEQQLGLMDALRKMTVLPRCRASPNVFRVRRSPVDTS